MNKRRIVSLLLALALCLGLSAPALAAGKFTDVPPTSPFAAAIDWAVEKNIANGTTPTTFSPNSLCTSNHIWRFLWRANGRPGDQGNETQAVKEWCGFSPDGTQCNRAAAVTAIWRVMGKPEPKQAVSFSDIPANCGYDKAVAWAVEAGITQGVGNGRFDPEGFCTRGQIVTFLYRAYGDSLAAAPEAKLPSLTSITVSSEKAGTNTMWTVSDNQNPNGYLNNGKPITEENVVELIRAVKELFPQGMSWSGNRPDGPSNFHDTNGFNTKNAVETEKVFLRYSSALGGGVGQDGGCGGFASLVSNYVFGQTYNPLRKLEDNSQARPGDMVFDIDVKTNKVTHVYILAERGVNSAVGKEGFTRGDGNYYDVSYKTEEGVLGIVQWDLFSTPKSLVNGVVWGDEQVKRCEVWTRYPA